jgi:hypothetical protein
MPLSVRPDGWTDEYIRSTVYHDPIPVVFEDRIYPLPLANTQDLEPDEIPIMVVMGGDLGELASLDEGRKNCFPDCVFDANDIQRVTDAIELAADIRDPARMARINMHIPLDLLRAENEGLLRELLSAVKGYVENGTTTWVTQGASYDALLGER